MKRIIKILICLTSVLCMLSSELSMQAFAMPDEPSLNSQCGAIYNVEFDRVLFEKNADQKISPASFAKILTAIIAIEYKNENEDIKPITVKEDIVKNSSGNILGLKAGEIISYNDLLHSLIMIGSNDSALVLADYICSKKGSNSFAELMNDKASEIGCKNSYFSNPTGIDDPLMYTTINDVIKICRYAYLLGGYMDIANKTEYVIPASGDQKEREIYNKNMLLQQNSSSGYYYKGAEGMNVGGTANAGYCLASTVRNGGITAIVIVSGAPVIEERNKSYVDVSNMFDYFKCGYTLKNILEKGNPVCEIPIELCADHDHAVLVSEETLQSLVDVDFSEKDLKFDYTLTQMSAKAPISKGEVFGEVQVFYNDEIIGSCNLVSQSEHELSIFLKIKSWISSIFGNKLIKVILILISAAILFILIILIISVIRQRARKNKTINNLEKEYFEKQKELYREYDKKRKTIRRKNRQIRYKKLRAAYREMTSQNSPGSNMNCKKKNPGLSSHQKHRGSAQSNNPANHRAPQVRSAQNGVRPTDNRNQGQNRRGGTGR